MHDLLQCVVDRPGCCYRTCLSVRLRGKRLDHFSELGTVEGLCDGDTVELVEGEGGGLWVSVVVAGCVSVGCVVTGGACGGRGWACVCSNVMNGVFVCNKNLQVKSLFFLCRP